MLALIAPADIDYVRLTMELFGGLALFLFGLDQMSDALRLVAGDGLRTILARLTKNRFLGVFTGACVTAVIQSSSVTTVLVVGFITAGLMSMTQSIGVIMGANIGTTVTAQIVAFKVTQYALAMVAIGYAVIFFCKLDTIRNHGRGIMGLGLIFLGMSIMGDAMSPLRSYEPFLVWMARMEVTYLGILAGALFTALIQSSSATTAVVIVLASQGLISLPAGIALCLGANIGTCVTALLAAIGKPREALRASIVHVLFNTLGVLVWLGFVDELATAVYWMSPSADDLSGSARLARETPRQIANAHTLFNIVNTLLFIGFTAQFARLVEWLVPDRPLAEEEFVRAKYIDSELIDTPSLALDRARLELMHMGERVSAIVAASLPAILDGRRTDLERVRAMDDAIDALHGQIVTYLGQISGAELSDSMSQELVDLLEAVNDLENIGDIVEMNLVNNGLARVDRGFRISDETREVLTAFHTIVAQAVEQALVAVTTKDEDMAARVVAMKAEIDDLARSAARHEAQRLVAKEPHRLPAYTVEVDIIENLKRIYYFARRLARTARA